MFWKDELQAAVLVCVFEPFAFSCSNTFTAVRAQNTHLNLQGKHTKTHPLYRTLHTRKLIGKIHTEFIGQKVDAENNCKKSRSEDPPEHSKKEHIKTNTHSHYNNKVSAHSSQPETCSVFNLMLMELWDRGKHHFSRCKHNRKLLLSPLASFLQPQSLWLLVGVVSIVMSECTGFVSTFIQSDA